MRDARTGFEDIARGEIPALGHRDRRKHTEAALHAGDILNWLLG